MVPNRATQHILHEYPFNPFLANVPILYSLKIPENLLFLSVFRVYKMTTLAENGSQTERKQIARINAISKYFIDSNRFSWLEVKFL